jgi:small-conductance mechanosensitive channel
MNPWRQILGSPQELLLWVHEHGLRIVAIVIASAVLLWIFRLLIRRVVAFAGGRGDSSREQQLRTLAGVTNSTAAGLIVIIAGLEIIQQLGISIGPLIASAGVVGLAVGFGAQTLVKDVITGFFVLLDDEYRVGDSIKAAGVQGKVERLTLRRTVLRDADGTLHFIPNSDLGVVSNLTRDWTLVSLPVAVHYKENSERVLEVLRAAAKEVAAMPEMREKVLADPVVPGIERVAGDEVDYLVQLKAIPGSQPEVLRALRARMKQALEQNGIEAWYPQSFAPKAQAGAPS